MHSPMKPIVLIPSLLIFIFITMNYQAVLGVFGAKLEAWKLRENARGRIVMDNPPDAADFFQDNLSDAWETRAINGSGLVNSGPEFGSGKFELKDGSLLMYLRKDPDFEKQASFKALQQCCLDWLSWIFTCVWSGHCGACNHAGRPRLFWNCRNCF
jgi:hypothetical protein